MSSTSKIKPHAHISTFQLIVTVILLLIILIILIDALYTHAERKIKYIKWRF